MKKSVRAWVTAVALVFVSGLLPTSRVNAAPSWLEQCVANINDPLFDKAFVLALTGYSTEADFETSVTNGTWTVQLATGSGAFGYHRGNNPDLYCGNGLNKNGHCPNPSPISCAMRMAYHRWRRFLARSHS